MDEPSHTGIVAWNCMFMKKPQKRWRVFLFVCFLLFYYFPSNCFQFCINAPSYPRLFYHSRCFSSSTAAQPLMGFFFLFLFPCSVSKWQWWESTVACHCHVNQIRRHNRKWVQMHGRSAVTHTHDLLLLRAKWRPSRHRYTDMNLLWVKGSCTVCQTASYSVHQIWHDIQSPEHLVPTSGSMWEITDSQWWFRENSAALF